MLIPREAMAPIASVMLLIPQVMHSRFFCWPLGLLSTLVGSQSGGTKLV